MQRLRGTLNRSLFRLGPANALETLWAEGSPVSISPEGSTMLIPCERLESAYPEAPTG
jgi:hypothetical protein